MTQEDTSQTRQYKEVPPNNALSIMGLGMNSSKAYPFAFGVVCPNPKDNIPGVVQAFVSRGQQMAGISLKRKAVKMSL